MKNLILIVLLAAVPAASAPTKAVSTEVERSARAVWSYWAEQNYPDASASWPKEASEALAKAAGEGWDFTGKGDYHLDGVPTAVLVRFESAKGPRNELVNAARVLKWDGGAWKEALLLGPGGKGTMNGKTLNLAAEFGKAPSAYSLSFMRAKRQDPGLWLTVYYADESGKVVSEASHYHYSVKTKLFDRDAY